MLRRRVTTGVGIGGRVAAGVGGDHGEAGGGPADDGSETPEIVLAREAPFRLGSLDVRPATLEVEAGGARATLEPRVMQVLVALARRRDAVLTREELNSACWGGRIVSEEALSRCILRLRRLAREMGGFEIETIPRVGYRLAESAGGAPASARKRPPVRRIVVVAMLAVVALIAGLGLVAFTRGNARDALESPRVEVGSFASQTPDPAAASLAAAVATEIMGVLHEGRVQAVSPRALSLYRPTYRIDGVVRSAGEDVFVRVRLRDASTGTALWSAEFARPKARSQTLASDAAWRVASVMATAISVQREEGERTDPVTLGLHLAVRDGMLSANPTAVRDTVARAPDFAWGRVAQSIYLLGRAAGAPPQEVEAYRRAAVAESEAAIRLNPGVPAYPVLADAMPTRAWAAREKLLRQGVRVARTPRSDSELALFLANAGRPREAFEIAWRLEPSTRYQIGHAVLLPCLTYLGGHGATGLKQAERVIRVRPHDQGARYGHLLLAAIAGSPGAANGVLADPLARPELRPEAAQAFAAFETARHSQRPRDVATAVSAVAAAAEARAIAPGHAVLLMAKLGADAAAMDLASAYAGDPRTLRLAVAAGTAFLFAPETAPLRADPRFVTVAERLGLTDYWRTSGRWPEFCEEEPRSVCAQIRGSSAAAIPAAAR